MFKKISIILICICALPAAATAVDLPTEHSTNSRFRLNYSDLDTVLKGSVLNMGPSTHNRARASRNSTGTKINLANPLPSRLEGNRVMFHLLKPDQIAFLSEMRTDLLNVPQKVPIEELSKNGQLAYWLNLHNAIVLAEIAQLYPITNIEPLFDQSDANAFYKQRRYDFDGQKISLEDIQNHVVENWNDPLVIYGFYMGAIGTPNIINTAFTAAEVMSQLKRNAIDFVNSVRGTEIWRRNELRVSTYYTRMGKAFPNFETDLLTHVRAHAKQSFLLRLSEIEEIKPQIENWYIADIYNGNLNRPAGSYPVTSLNNLGLVTTSDLPDHVIELLSYRKEKLARQQRNEEVAVEELEDGNN
ncbi:DUF547 domain-containing protein [Kordiimonas aquimaris]|uniref:DUF547 domain-containing protein n=1 Tax=Kordiimonas aquimaris TaxID=707591 RepID=UPI0021D2E2EB|nr:DUF547 domain-containing protein [Kordiimonas aquimaris]